MTGDQNSRPAQGGANNHDDLVDGHPALPVGARSAMKVGRQATDAFLEAQDDLLEAIRDGATIREAALQAGVPERTVRSWLTKGRRGEGDEYADFAAEVDQTRTLQTMVAGAGSHDEFIGGVWKAIRAGSVPAMRLYWEMTRGGPAVPSSRQEPEDPLAFCDELAARRGGRAEAS